MISPLKNPAMFDISKFWIYKIRSNSMKSRKITNEHDQLSKILSIIRDSSSFKTKSNTTDGRKRHLQK